MKEEEFESCGSVGLVFFFVEEHMNAGGKQSRKRKSRGQVHTRTYHNKAHLKSEQGSNLMLINKRKKTLPSYSVSPSLVALFFFLFLHSNSCNSPQRKTATKKNQCYLSCVR